MRPEGRRLLQRKQHPADGRAEGGSQAGGSPRGDELALVDVAQNVHQQTGGEPSGRRRAVVAALPALPQLCTLALPEGAQ